MKTNRKSGGMSLLGMGCLTAVLIFIAVVFVGVRYGGSILRTTGSAAAITLIDNVLSELGFPGNEKTEIMKPVKALGERVKSGDVSFDQLTQIAERFIEGPAMMLCIVRGFQLHYVDLASISEEEKQQAYAVSSRYGRGLVEFPDLDTDDELLEIIFVEDKNGENSEFKPSLTPGELKRALEIMQQAADEAGVPDEPYVIDIPAAIRQAIDEGMRAEPVSGS